MGGGLGNKIDRLYDEQCGVCGYCGAICSRAGWSADHIIPKSQGGPNFYWNLLGCCHACNSKKADHSARVMARLHPTRLEVLLHPKVKEAQARMREYVQGLSQRKVINKQGIKLLKRLQHGHDLDWL